MSWRQDTPVLNSIWPTLSSSSANLQEQHLDSSTAGACFFHHHRKFLIIYLPPEPHTHTRYKTRCSILRIKLTRSTGEACARLLRLATRRKLWKRRMWIRRRGRERIYHSVPIPSATQAIPPRALRKLHTGRITRSTPQTQHILQCI